MVKGGQGNFAHIKSKKLCLANGDEFVDTEFDVSQDVLEKFIEVKAGTKTIMVNPDFILSYEESKNKFKAI